MKFCIVLLLDRGRADTARFEKCATCGNGPLPCARSPSAAFTDAKIVIMYSNEVTRGTVVLESRDFGYIVFVSMEQNHGSRAVQY